MKISNIPYVILKVEELQMFDIFKIFDKCDVNHRETFTDKSNNGSFDLLTHNLMVIGTCCTGSCKSNYHTNTTSPQTRYMILQSTLKLRCSIM
jgi:hypothetical protein